MSGFGPGAEGSATREIEEAILEVGWAHRRAALSFEIGGTAPPDRLCSRLGGLPLMPPGEQWPRDSRGRPLSLLAQVKCADLAPLPGFPHTGLLQFFGLGAGPGWGVGASGYDVQDGFRVLYWDAAPLAAVDPPPGTSDRLPFYPPGSWALRFGPAVELRPMTACEWRFEPLLVRAWSRVHPQAPLRLADDGCGLPAFLEAEGCPGELWVDEVAAVCPPRGSRSQVGGWPSFEQCDPRLWPDCEGLRRYDTVLFQLDSSIVDDGVRPWVEWGDGGVGVFLINGDDLRRLDFSRVMYYWDCG